MKASPTIACWGVLLMAAPALSQAVSAPPGPPAALPSSVPMVASPDASSVASPVLPNAAAPSLDLQRQLDLAVSPQRTSSTLQVLLLMTVLALVPSILVLMTSFTRIVVVLGLLRQAMATPQLPPNSVMLGLALLMTVVVMAPVAQAVHQDAVSPYLAGKVGRDEAVRSGESHVRRFMIRQIEAGGNAEDVHLFLRQDLVGREGLTWGEVPTMSLIPAYVVSELKIAFLMGFRIFLPFLVIDMLVAAVLVSMGILMLPPVLVSLPLKLLLFVMADGWHLVVGTLVRSFG